MLQFKFSRALVASMLAAAARVIPFSKAGAAVFVGTFDPSFGGNLFNLGFRGQATFFVPDACLGTSGFVPNTVDSCAGGNMSMTAATVELYRYEPNTPNAPTLDSATFATPAEPELLVDVLLSSISGQTSLLGVNTGVIGSRQVDVVYTTTIEDMPTTTTIYSGDIWLQFFEPPFDSEGRSAGAYLYACDLPRVEGSCSRIRSDPAQVTLVQIPEPATWGLVLAALASSVFMRRRASRRR